jgi:hypothetical protein
LAAKVWAKATANKTAATHSIEIGVIASTGFLLRGGPTNAVPVESPLNQHPRLFYLAGINIAFTIGISVSAK